MNKKVSKFTYPILQHCLTMPRIMNGDSMHYHKNRSDGLETLSLKEALLPEKLLNQNVLESIHIYAMCS